MGDNIVAQDAQPLRQQQQQPQNPYTSPWEIMKSLASRMLMMYAVVTAMNYYRGKPGQSSSNTSSDVINELSGNMFQKGTFFVSFF
jgi:hypothetical protein